MNDLLQTDCGVDELVQEAESIETELQTMEGLLEDEEELNKDKNRDGGLFL